MSRGLVGAGLGAAGATVYLQPELVQQKMKEAVFGRPLQTLSPAVGKELENLQRLVSGSAPAAATEPALITRIAALTAISACPSCFSYLTLQQVEDLSRQVAASGKQQPGAVTVVHTGAGDRTGSYVLYGCTAAGLGVVLYMRVLRGWTFGDMCYATRRGLRDGLQQVSTGDQPACWCCCLGWHAWL